MFKIRDKNKTPPHGFTWVDPLTSFEINARSYPNWRSAALEHRGANNNPVPSEEEMDDQFCMRLSEKERERWCTFVDTDGPKPILGVGGVLKEMLAAIGISSCWSCVDTAGQMDRWGPDGCEEHMGEIVAIMERNANKKNWLRFIPFKQQGAELLVRRAISTVRERDRLSTQIT